MSLVALWLVALLLLRWRYGLLALSNPFELVGRASPVAAMYGQQAVEQRAARYESRRDFPGPTRAVMEADAERLMMKRMEELGRGF
jgi:hypothetical protein